MESLIAIERLVPGNAGVGQRGNGGLHAKHDHRGRAKAKVYEDAGEIGLREEYGVDGILTPRHRHAHVRSRVVGPMESPQPGNLMMHPVIPILRQVIGDAENQNAPEEREPSAKILC